MNIATALNRKYIDYTIVMLTSLCINNRSHIDAYLMHNELTGEDISYITANLSKYDIKIIPIFIDESDLPGNLSVTDQWTIETYFRLLMIDKLPAAVDRILYLDVDVIVNKNISELYDIDFGDSLICAASDSNGIRSNPENLLDKQREMLGAYFDDGYKYFNAGVMLYHLDAIRKLYNFQTYLDAMKAWNFNMPANDQDILNYVYHDKVLYIDWNKYDLFTHLAYNNGMTEAEADKVTILHFAGFKPWDTFAIHYEIEDIWWKYAAKTDIYFKLMQEYISQMTQDKSMEQYIGSLTNKISEQEDTIKKLISYSKQLLEKLNS